MTESGDSLKYEKIEDLSQGGEKDFRLEPGAVGAAVEALLFVAGDPLSLEKIAAITGINCDELRQILARLGERYRHDPQRGIILREIDGNYVLTTKPEQKEILQRLFQPRHRPVLSQAAYETLAIIAYNQPVTRSQVESVRGVNSDSIISRLLERELIREDGTLDAPGRPSLFVTTDKFLLDFGLRSVNDLPPMEMLMYGTLRDFEANLEEAAGRGPDRQLSIDQLVNAFVPDKAVPETASNADYSDVNLPESDVIDFSGAVFGDDNDDEDTRKIGEKE